MMPLLCTESFTVDLMEGTESHNAAGEDVDARDTDIPHAVPDTEGLLCLLIAFSPDRVGRESV